jgi:MFS family permease
MRGRAFGAFHAAIGLSALPASILFGLWWTLLGPRTAFLIGAAVSLAATAALFLSRGTFARAEKAEAKRAGASSDIR